MALCDLAASMSIACTIEEGSRLLMRAGDQLNLPLVAAVENLSWFEPLRDENGQRLLDIFGWPKNRTDKTIADLSRGHLPRSWGAIRARIEGLPFVWRLGKNLLGDSGAWDRSSDLIEALGITVVVVVPVRRARGCLAVIYFCGNQSAKAAEALLHCHGPTLLGLAHYFFRLAPEKSNMPRFPEDFAGFSQRELECLTLAASGKSDVEISGILKISQYTVRFHVENAKKKLHSKSRTHAIAVASQVGLIGSLV